MSEVRRPIFVSDIFAHTELQAAPVFDAGNERTRPNLKVQDGCDNRCSFCVIPYVRGQSRSLPLAEVIREVEALVSAGYREVVISGINLGRWGKRFGRQLSAFSQRPTTNGQRPTARVSKISSAPSSPKLRCKNYASVRSNPWTGVTNSFN